MSEKQAAPVLVHLDWLETGIPGGNPPRQPEPSENEPVKEEK